jgi:hypothetical protein
LGISHETVRADLSTSVNSGVKVDSGVDTRPPTKAAVSEFKPDNEAVKEGHPPLTAGAGEAPTLADTRSSARPGFAIALFACVDRPAVEPRTVSLDELVDLLSTFDVLDDKRHGRCWSPTRYADGATSRGNAGVEAVSCLVFDCDRVEPDWGRLEGYWYLGHTTYQHMPEHPRWRLVLPLAAPVPATQWRTCGSAPAPRCAPKPIPSARMRAASITCPATRRASCPTPGAMRGGC